MKRLFLLIQLNAISPQVFSKYPCLEVIPPSYDPSEPLICLYLFLPSHITL